MTDLSPNIFIGVAVSCDVFTAAVRRCEAAGGNQVIRGDLVITWSLPGVQFGAAEAAASAAEAPGAEAPAAEAPAAEAPAAQAPAAPMPAPAARSLALVSKAGAASRERPSECRRPLPIPERRRADLGQPPVPRPSMGTGVLLALLQSPMPSMSADQQLCEAVPMSSQRESPSILEEESPPLQPEEESPPQQLEEESPPPPPPPSSPPPLPPDSPQMRQRLPSLESLSRPGPPPAAASSSSSSGARDADIDEGRPIQKLLAKYEAARREQLQEEQNQQRSAREDEEGKEDKRRRLH